MNPTTSFHTKATSVRPATISNDKEDARREILKTHFFERIDRGIGADETPLYTLGQGRETLSDAEARHQADRTALLLTSRIHVTMKGQKGGHTLAHPRLGSAPWLEPLTAPGAAQACPARLPFSANQLIFRGVPRLGHPFVASSLMPLAGLRAQRIGGLISAFPAISLRHDRPCPALFPPGDDHLPSTLLPAHTAATQERKTRRARTFGLRPTERRDEAPPTLLPFRRPASVHRASTPSHQQRPARSRIGHNSDRHPGQNRPLSACSTKPAYQTETPISPSVFNLSHAPESIELSDLSGHSPHPNVIGHSDFPGGITARFLTRKNPRPPRVRARSERHQFLFNSQNT